MAMLFGAAVAFAPGRGAAEPEPASGPAPAHEPVVSEGVFSHKVDRVAALGDYRGRGVKVGVISNNVKYIGELQAMGELPAVTVIEGKSGEGLEETQGRKDSEGTALLEIVHDIAPEAELYFATGYPDQAAMAESIRALVDAGCKVIVDDVTHPGEPAFQDGVIAQAINEAVAAGCIVFSASGNFGNKESGRSGTWEGDFVPVAIPEWLQGLLADHGRGDMYESMHDFGTSDGFNTVIGLIITNSTDQVENASIYLQWADPWGASTNDYDIFILDRGNCSFITQGIKEQKGDIDPIEGADGASNGCAIAVLKKFGAEPRYLRINSSDAAFEISSTGSAFGHSACSNTIAIACSETDYRSPRPFSVDDKVQPFSSDGPRRMFFEPDGTPITPEDFSSTGGRVIDKVDFTAADGVLCATPGFYEVGFFGTSAAAPHAAGIAALMLEVKPDLTRDEIFAVMRDTAIRPAERLWNCTYGYGMIDAEACIAMAIEQYVEHPVRITFDANGGAIYGQPRITCLREEGTVVGSLSGKIPEPTWPLYEFEGWFSESGEPLDPDAGIVNDVTYYARWSSLVAFDANGGEFYGIAPTPDPVTGALPEPLRPSYVFDGWYTEREGGELFDGSVVAIDNLPITLYAHWVAVEYYYYVDGDGNAVITGAGITDRPGMKIAGALAVPAELNGHAVTAIGSGAFSGFTGIKRVDLPDSLVTIGYKAFYWCESLTEINLPPHLLSIGEEAFSCCSGLSRIGFKPREMEDIDGYNNCTETLEIGPGAFFNCTSLREIVLPVFVKYISGGAFERCERLESVRFDAGVNMWESAVDIGEYAFYKCTSLRRVSIDARDFPYNYLRIYDNAFNGCSALERVDLGMGVYYMGGYLFADCTSLAAIELPASVQMLGNCVEENPKNTFEGSSLETISVASGNAYFAVSGGLLYSTDEYGEFSVVACPPRMAGNVRVLDTIYMLEGISAGAFHGCSLLEKVELPYELQAYVDESEVFAGCGESLIVKYYDDFEIPLNACGGVLDVYSIAVPRINTELGPLPEPVRPGWYFVGWYTSAEGGERITQRSKLTKAMCAGEVSLYARWAEIIVEYTRMVIASGKIAVTGATAYARPNNEAVPCEISGALDIPEYIASYLVAEISSGAFAGNSGITSLTIPAGVKAIGEGAFADCTSLATVSMPSTLRGRGYEGSVFMGCSPDIAIEYYQLPYGGSVIVDEEKATVEELEEGGYVVTAKDGETLDDSDFSFGSIAREAYVITYNDSENPTSAVVTLATPSIPMDEVAEETKAEDDPSGLVCNAAMVDPTEIAELPTPEAGEELGALPVTMYEGLYYQAAWGESLESLESGKPFLADGTQKYIGVIKQTGKSGFYKISVSEKMP